MIMSSISHFCSTHTPATAMFQTPDPIWIIFTKSLAMDPACTFSIVLKKPTCSLPVTFQGSVVYDLCIYVKWHAWPNKLSLVKSICRKHTLGTWRTEPCTWTAGPGIWASGPGNWTAGPGTWTTGPGTWTDFLSQFLQAGGQLILTWPMAATSWTISQVNAALRNSRRALQQKYVRTMPTVCSCSDDDCKLQLPKAEMGCRFIAI